MGFTITAEKKYEKIGCNFTNVYVTNKCNYRVAKRDGTYYITSNYFGFTSSNYQGLIPIIHGTISEEVDSYPENIQVKIYTKIKELLQLHLDDFVDDL